MELAKNLKTESVSRLHPTTPWQVRPEQTVGQVVELMRDKSVGCVLVSEQGKIVGIFTERDLMRRVLAAGKSLDAPIRDFMTANPVAVSSKDPIEKAVRLMEEGGYRHLPVVDQGKPVGILSVKRIVHYLVEHFPTAVYNLPPDSQASVGKNREGA